MEKEYRGASIKEVKSNKPVKEDLGADLYLETGMTGGRTFLVRVEGASDKATLIALHL